MSTTLPHFTQDTSLVDQTEALAGNGYKHMGQLENFGIAKMVQPTAEDENMEKWFNVINSNGIQPNVTFDQKYIDWISKKEKEADNLRIIQKLAKMLVNKSFVERAQIMQQFPELISKVTAAINEISEGQKLMAMAKLMGPATRELTLFLAELDDGAIHPAKLKLMQTALPDLIASKYTNETEKKKQALVNDSSGLLTIDELLQQDGFLYRNDHNNLGNIESSDPDFIQPNQPMLRRENNYGRRTTTGLGPLRTLVQNVGGDTFFRRARFQTEGGVVSTLFSVLTGSDPAPAEEEE